MEISKSLATPLVVNEKLSKNEVNIKADAFIYRSLIGSLLYLSTTRPDLMFSVSLISRFMHSPSKIHFGVAKRVLSQDEATVIWVNNKSAIAIAKNPVQHRRTKHINVNFHAIREAEKNSEVNLVHCCSENQIADILTKALSKAKFEELRSRLGVSKKILKEEC
ncbi:hypothetical protein AAG906_041080 [Vitis piasezkii]